MERLTERFSNGQAAVLGCGSNCKYDFKYCENHLEDCPTINEIYEKLADYEDLEEQGKLLKLPCAVGDTVYRIGGNMEVCEVTVESISFGVYGRDNQLDISANGFHYKVKDIGKMLFLSKEEAEAALREMNEREGVEDENRK